MITSKIKIKLTISGYKLTIKGFKYFCVPLLPTHKTNGFMRLGQPLRMRTRIPEQWQST